MSWMIVVASNHTVVLAALWHRSESHPRSPEHSLAFHMIDGNKDVQSHGKLFTSDGNPPESPPSQVHACTYVKLQRGSLGGRLNVGFQRQAWGGHRDVEQKAMPRHAYAYSRSHAF
jgi:hypothetical protein